LAQVARCSSKEAAWHVAWTPERFLQHGNAPSHTSPVVEQFLAETDIPVITQPPQSPDLPPSDLWIFPTLKMDLKEIFPTILEDMKSKATAELRKIPKETFCRFFQKW
jgi:hypothetical protein